MNSQVTLVNNTPVVAAKGQVQLVYKRMDQRHAALLEDDSSKYFLATSEDGTSKVKIYDTSQQMVAEVNCRTILSDTITLTNRNGGKPMKAVDVLKEVPSGSAGRASMALYTAHGAYYWCKSRNHHWALYGGSSSNPVVWTETVPGSAPTWMLVLESCALSVVDYVLASLFYLKSQPGNVDGWERVDHRTAWPCTK